MPIDKTTLDTLRQGLVTVLATIDSTPPIAVIYDHEPGPLDDYPAITVELDGLERNAPALNEQREETQIGAVDLLTTWWVRVYLPLDPPDQMEALMLGIFGGLVGAFDANERITGTTIQSCGVENAQRKVVRRAGDDIDLLLGEFRVAVWSQHTAP